MAVCGQPASWELQQPDLDVMYELTSVLLAPSVRSWRTELYVCGFNVCSLTYFGDVFSH